MNCSPSQSNAPTWPKKESHSLPGNPWKIAQNSDLNMQSSFKDLMSEDLAKMSEDLAKKLNKSETDKLLQGTATEDINSSFLDLEPSVDTSNDLLLALLLQREFNKEHDSQIQREENHINKNSKLSVSFSKYKMCPQLYESESEDDFHLDDENRALDSFEESRRSDPVIPACGYIVHNNQMITKHDKIISGRRNAEKVMNFPPGINTGDGGGFDMQISNKVYNRLARTAVTESRRKQRINDKIDKATAEKALDPKTRLIIYKMVNNSIMEIVNGIISTGKESVVFHANGGIYEDKELPAECAVKVFKTTLTDFKTRERYIRDDYRFKNRMSKNNNKMTIQLWAEKEFHNLRRLQNARIASPRPLLIRKHVLVMSFIGNQQIAAPKLKHTKLSYDQWKSAFDQVVDIMCTMYRDCKLVHGDMSEFNLLWYEDKCWVIDLGQAVEPVHPNALKFLYRDCTNVIGFFKSKGLSDLPTPSKLFETVTGIDLCGKEEDAEALIEEYETNQKLGRSGGKDKDDPFEFLWAEMKKNDEGAAARWHLEDAEKEEEQREERSLPPDDACDLTAEESRRKNRRRRPKQKAPITTSKAIEYADACGAATQAL